MSVSQKNNVALSTDCKVHILWEGHKVVRNLHCRFTGYYLGDFGGDFAKFVAFSEYNTALKI